MVSRFLCLHPLDAEDMDTEDGLLCRDLAKGAKGTGARYDYSWSGIIGRVSRRALPPTFDCPPLLTHFQCRARMTFRSLARYQISQGNGCRAGITVTEW